MRSRWRGDERGSATAELAVALPVVAALLAVCITAVLGAGLRVQLTDAAADAARALSRGDAVASALTGGAAVRVTRSDGLVCVRLEQAVTARGILAAVLVSGSACAADGGR